MSLLVKNLGWWKADSKHFTRPNKLVLPTTTGTTLVVVADPNDADPFAINNTYGDGTNTAKIRIFEINAAFTTATEVASFTTAALDYPIEAIAADLYEDNSIGIAFKTSASGIQYRKVTYGTWAVAAVETVASPSLPVRNLDVSISVADVPAVAWIQTDTANPKAQLRVQIKAATGGAWTTSNTTTLATTADPNLNMFSLSIQWGRGGTAAARPLAILVANSPLDAADVGFRLYTAVGGESGGTLANVTLRTTYLAGDMTGKWGTFPRRGYLFESATNQFTVAIMQAADENKLLVARFTWDNTTYAETIAPQTSVAGAEAIDKTGRFAATYANGRVAFYYIADYRTTYLTPINYIASIDGVNVRFSGPFKWDNVENVSQDRFYPVGGTGKRAGHANALHSMIFFGVNNNNLWHMRAHRPEPALAPTELTPTTGAVATSALPQLSFRGRLGKTWPQSKHKAVWQLATDAGFTANLRTFTQTDDKFINMGDTSKVTSYVYFADTLPAAQVLTSGTWYVRGALVDEFGVMGAWSGTNNFTLLHPPSAINRTPSAGQTMPDSSVQFTWEFSDPSPSDTQSAYQIVVTRNDNGTVVYDSGKITSGLTSHLATISSTYVGLLLQWSIRLWDADNTAGDYSSEETFSIASPPTVVINSPLNGATVASGTPRIDFTPTVSNGRMITRYQVLIYDLNNVLLRDSGVVPVSVASGTLLQWRVQGEVLPDNQQIKITVIVGDESGQTGTDTEASVTINYVEPAAPAGLTASTASYNVDDLGYATITWNDTTRDANFVAWVVSRRVDSIDAGGNVVATGTWEDIGEVTVTTANYTYKDYYAPSGSNVVYSVRQLVNSGGDYAISARSATATVTPRTEGYWIVQPGETDATTTAFRLHNVTSDEFTDEYEENTYTIIGRGRHVDVGDHLGVNGTLVAQLRDTGATTARQKKKRLEDARAADSAVRLRNPFGDVYLVRVGNLQISRLAGVGTSEFVDVTIPYVEVSE